ncbi:MAG TPA: DUF86 domain-containing protein [Candidatus Nanoarchaeia archaeon]|nr:DUF86 domain-containing protein [Candidatus Nanoarchaeia archaeon]
MTKHDDIPYLKHILDAINDIQESIGNKQQGEFNQNKDVKDATIRRLEIIGEAAKHVSTELKKKSPEVQWKAITGTRDVMIHAYFKVDLDVVWRIVKRDLPRLKQQIEIILTNS